MKPHYPCKRAVDERELQKADADGVQATRYDGMQDLTKSLLHSESRCCRSKSNDSNRDNLGVGVSKMKKTFFHYS
jgi:hypothetical protein